MNKDRFYELLHNPQSTYSDDDVALLREVVNQYPYFHAAHLLLAKAEHSRNSIHYEKSLQTAAAYAGNRELLYSLINGAESSGAVNIPEPIATEVTAPSNVAGPEISLQAEEQEKVHKPAEEPEVAEQPAAEEAAPIEIPASFPDQQNEQITTQEEVAETPPTEEIEEEVLEEPAAKTKLPTEEPVAPLHNGAEEKFTEQAPAEEEQSTAQEKYEAPQEPKIYYQEEIQTEVYAEGTEEQQPFAEHEAPAEEHPGIPDPEEQAYPAEVPPIQFEYPVYDLEREYTQETASDPSPEPEPEQLPEIVEEPQDVTSPKENTQQTEQVKHSFSEWLKVLNSENKTDQAQKEEASTEQPVPEKSSQTEVSQNNSLHIIEQFIEREPRIKPLKSNFFSPATMAQKSVEEPEDIATETLAQIYLKQGNYKKAMKIYEKLALIYPEKSNYFAARIEETKKKE